MTLVEIARYDDVYEADLAAAFLESHNSHVTVTERFQTTVDPLMQRALGLRLLGVEGDVETARELLRRAQAGEFREADGDDIPPRGDATWLVGSLAGTLAGAAGLFWGSTLPRRFRAPPWQGVLISTLAVVAFFGVLSAAVLLGYRLFIDPP